MNLSALDLWCTTLFSKPLQEAAEELAFLVLLQPLLHPCYHIHSHWMQIQTPSHVRRGAFLERAFARTKA